MSKRSRTAPLVDAFRWKRSAPAPERLLRCTAGLLLATAIAWGLPSEGRAHPLAPSLLELHERPDGLVDVRFKTPVLQARGAAHSPRLPFACEPVGGANERREGSGVVIEYRVDCGEAGLTGRIIGIDGLEAGVANALVRVVSPRGDVRQALLSASDPVFVVPDQVAAATVAGSYVVLGTEHLVFGFDHVLFVLGLLMLIRGRRLLLLTITSFTLGHSVTLALAVLGFVRFPTGLVEVGIAASLLLLAMEIPAARAPDTGRRAGLFERRPWLVALGFGLLHGLGFAGALAEIGLPPEDVPLALFSFNVGIEIGQLALVACVLALVQAATWMHWPTRSPALRTACIAGIGTLAGYWVIERAWALFFVV